MPLTVCKEAELNTVQVICEQLCRKLDVDWAVHNHIAGVIGFCYLVYTEEREHVVQEQANLLI